MPTKRDYYQRWYPAELIVAAFSHPFREYAFILEGDRWLRHLTFPTAKELRAAIGRYNPVRIEIGPIYEAKPRTGGNVKAVARELTIDIDMDEYDSIRTCGCTGKKVCDNCWGFVRAAMAAINYRLETEWGITRYIWVFSGGRGAHCWVLDERCKAWNDDMRKAFYAAMFTIEELHPSLATLVDKVLMPHFTTLAPIIKAANGVDPDQLQELALNKLVLQSVFPRIDKRVTEAINHTLKSPFAVHPSTNNISLPIDETFVPSLAMNLDNFNEAAFTAQTESWRARTAALPQ